MCKYAQHQWGECQHTICKLFKFSNFPCFPTDYCKVKQFTTASQHCSFLPVGIQLLHACAVDWASRSLNIQASYFMNFFQVNDNILKYLMDLDLTLTINVLFYQPCSQNHNEVTLVIKQLGGPEQSPWNGIISKS